MTEHLKQDWTLRPEGESFTEYFNSPECLKRRKEIVKNVFDKWREEQLAEDAKYIRDLMNDIKGAL